MFWRSHKGTESDAGYSVKLLGRAGLIYTEGSKSVRIDSEILMGPDALVVYSKSIKNWDKRSGGEAIDDKTRDRIINNIRKVCAFEGFGIEVD